jgi:aminopeptidase N
MAHSRDEAALDAVFEATRYGHPTRARRAAIAALPLLSDGRAVREHLEKLLDDSDPYLRISVIAALRTLGDAKARRALGRHLEHELDGRVARRAREATRELGQSARDNKRLGDELEKVRGQLVELTMRLSKLEAKTKSTDSDTPKGRGAKGAKSPGRKKTKKKARAAKRKPRPR